MNKTVFITGTSSGIGKATAIYFQNKGWNVIATMRNPEKDTTLSSLQHVIVLPLDVTKSETIADTIHKGIQTFGSIDVVVNNAGYGLVGPFEAAAQEDVERQFKTNVYGLMNVVQAILPYFRQKKDGVIINIASMGGRLTFPLYSLYHATKWAVEGFSESLQYELLPFNIKVKIIEPGPIKTDFYSRSMTLMKKGGLTAYDDYINHAMPTMQKSGATGATPEQVAETIYAAATDNSWKLRYQTDFNGRMLLWLRSILSDGVFMGLMRKVIVK